MITRTIGKVGIDNICINNFKNMPNIFGGSGNDLLNYYQLPDPAIDPNIILSKNGKVTRVHILGDGFQYVYGNRKNRSQIEAFSYLQIFASNKDGDNLCNMSVTKIWQRFYLACLELKNKYGIELHFVEKELNVRYLEINISFPLEEKFHDYSFFTDLIKILSCEEGDKIKEIGSFCENKEYNVEYIQFGKKTYPTVIYNKTVDLIEKKKNKLSVLVPQTDVMRYEIRMEKLVSLCSFFQKEMGQSKFPITGGSFPMCFLSDKLIEKYFIYSVNKIFSLLDKYFMEKLSIILASG